MRGAPRRGKSFDPSCTRGRKSSVESDCATLWKTWPRRRVEVKVVSVKTTSIGRVTLLVALTWGVTSTPARAFVPPNTSVGHRVATDMVYVPAASFKLGIEASWGGPTPGKAFNGDNPAGVDVHLASFFMDRTEVTAGQYQACVLAGACTALTQGDTSNSKEYTQLCTYQKPGHENHPVNCVSHAEAKQYCTWAGKRLPTDAEFELAERGPNGKPFPWGDEPPSPKRVNACDASLVRDQAKIAGSFTSMWPDGGDDGWAFTAPVGSYPDGASPYGALDMSGNVDEWTADAWWDMTGGATGPKGPATGDGDRVVRGGAWDLNSIDSFAATRRVNYQSTTRAAWLGFRCAKDG